MKGVAKSVVKMQWKWGAKHGDMLLNNEKKLVGDYHDSFHGSLRT